MPPFQTTEALRPNVGFPGMMSDTSEWNGLSGFILSASARPGHPVQFGAADRTFAPFTTGTFAGILRAHITSAPEGVFTENSMLGAVDEGVIFVRPGGTCTRGAPAYFDPTANDGEGGYSDEGGVFVPGTEFLIGGTEADPVVTLKVRKMMGLTVAPEV